MSNLKKIVYVFNADLIRECDRIPAILNRASMVHELISEYGFLTAVKTCSPFPANEDQLLSFHTSDYLQSLRSACEEEEQGNDDEFGLDYDCPKFPDLFKFCKVIAGGSLAAAEEIINGAQVAINWCGGWHHAQRDKAAGFCYINDVVIGIQKLTKHFDRVLYLDLDVHHGDGVENAFSCSKRVLTVSFHLHEPGFFPGTGDVLETGFGPGKGYSINFPFRRYFSGEKYRKYFKIVMEKVLKSYKPQVAVVQCGADILPGDPLGGANLTLQDMGECVKFLIDSKKPLILLGGGGYNLANTARYWTFLTSVVCNVTLDEDIPDNKFFLDYGPTYELGIEPIKSIADPNRSADLDKNVEFIEDQLNKISLK